MSQSTHADQHPSSEPDPLLEYLAEPQSARAPVRPPAPAAPAELVEKTADAGAPAAEPAKLESDPELRRRMELVERLLEKSAIEISTLKSDLATLVSAFDDIKKRPGRRFSQPPVAPPRRWSGAASAVAAVLLIVTGFALWGVISAASNDDPDLTRIETVSVEPVEQPAAVATPFVPPIEVQKAPVSTVLPARDVPARAESAPRNQPRPTAAYVGTLTVDASPAGEVFLNRENVGRTPLRLENLRAGSHLIWIERDGFRRWTRVVPVAANSISRVTADLDPGR